MCDKTKLNTKIITRIGGLTAISVILMFFDFPISFVAPSFYKLDFSESVILVGGFAYGPAAAAVMELLKNLIILAIKGTSTGFVGEFANFLMGCAFTVPAAVVYSIHKTRKTALISLAIGSASLAVVGGIVNYFIVIPVYSNVFFGGNIDAIVEMGRAIFPPVKSLYAFVMICTIPFNIIKGIACSIICYLLYKRVSPILHI